VGCGSTLFASEPAALCSRAEPSTEAAFGAVAEGGSLGPSGVMCRLRVPASLPTPTSDRNVSGLAVLLMSDCSVGAGLGPYPHEDEGSGAPAWRSFKDDGGGFLVR
jgi:hypothetical protein